MPHINPKTSKLQSKTIMLQPGLSPGQQIRDAVRAVDEFASEFGPCIAFLHGGPRHPHVHLITTQFAAASAKGAEILAAVRRRRQSQSQHS